jgi:hypothetical protein
VLRDQFLLCLRWVFMAQSITPNLTTRFAGTSAPHGLPARGSHSAHFYASDAALVAEVGPRLAAALLAGGTAVVLAQPPRRQALARYLDSRGIDLAHVAGQGRWLPLDAGKALREFMVDDVPDPDRFSALIGGIFDRLADPAHARAAASVSVAAYGEMAATLWESGNANGSIRLENLWSDLVSTHAVHFCCGWPLRLFSSSTDALAVDSICSAHSHVTPALGYNAMSNDERRRGGFLWQLKAHKVLQNVSRISRQTLGFYRDAPASAHISVSDAIDEVLAIYEYRLRLNDISVRRNVRDRLTIRWTEGECKHILSNLIANAVDASAVGASIYIAARDARHPVTAAPGLRIVVGDRGTGIPRSESDRVFTPFFVGRKDINIGLGLWTVKDLLDKRGGFIRCRSRVAVPGDPRLSGTLMTAFLPAEPSSSTLAA